MGDKVGTAILATAKEQAADRLGLTTVQLGRFAAIAEQGNGGGGGGSRPAGAEAVDLSPEQEGVGRRLCSCFAAASLGPVDAFDAESGTCG